MARELAETHLALLEDDGRRLRHTRTVAARSALASPVLPDHQRHLLMAAAWLHDIGYAPAVAMTGHHPLDGALYLRHHLWPLEVAALVAHHSAARFLTAHRGLGHLLAPFDHARHFDSPVADALTWADQTTSPTGQVVDPEVRIAEVLQRHGPDSDRAAVHERRSPWLRAAVRATEQRLAERGLVPG